MQRTSGVTDNNKNKIKSGLRKKMLQSVQLLIIQIGRSALTIVQIKDNKVDLKDFSLKVKAVLELSKISHLLH